jgi:hypothetical protein
MLPGLQVIKSDCTGTAFIGLYLEEVTYMYENRCRNIFKRINIESSWQDWLQQQL